MSEKETVQHIAAQDTRLSPAPGHVDDGAPLQHIGAQEQIPNAQTLKAAEKLKAKKPEAAERKVEAEQKTAEPEDEHASYKTRESRAHRARQPGATVQPHKEDDKKET